MEINGCSLHNHPLKLYCVESSEAVIIVCDACKSEIGNQLFLACLQCKYNIHMSCVEPFCRQINCLGQQGAPNSANLKHYKCVRCHVFWDFETRSPGETPTKSPSNQLTFSEGDSPEKKTFSEGEMRYRRRWRQGKIHGEIIRNHPRDNVCYACGKPVGWVTLKSYSINDLYFHNDCILHELSIEIRHPIDRSHPLFLCFALLDNDDDHHLHGQYNCSLCGRQISDSITFQCFLCEVVLCLECVALRPAIWHPDHDYHQLYLDDQNDEINEQHGRCNAHDCYAGSLKQLAVASKEVAETQGYIFRCEYCEHFSLHLFCGPLPCVVKHECHAHPLTLYDSIVEDGYGEYYCDACETERDPRARVYYCAQCKYFAHVHCVISEVVRILKGDCREVELCVLGQRKFAAIEMDGSNNDIAIRPQNTLIDKKWVVKKEVEGKPTVVMTLSDLISKVRAKWIREYEPPLIKTRLFKWRELRKKDQEKKEKVLPKKEKKEKDEEDDAIIIRDPELQLGRIIREFSPYNKEEEFKELIHALTSYSSTREWSMSVTRREANLKLVYVGDYMITWNLALVLEDLLAKYGDVSGEKSRSPAYKSLLYFVLCRLLNSMSTTMAVDVTEHLLQDWYSCWQFLTSKGFRVDSFVGSEGLEPIVRCYFGFQASRARDDVKRRLDTGREMVTKFEAELKRYKERLEAYATQWESGSDSDEQAVGSSGESNFIKKCSGEASKFKWRKAASVCHYKHELNHKAQEENLS